MTKRVNKIFFIIAITYLLISILIPIIDYFISKNIVFSKVEGMTSQEMQNYYKFYKDNMSIKIHPNDTMKYNSFYEYFFQQYVTINNESTISRTYYELWDNTDFPQMFGTAPVTDNETFYIWYIMGKLIWVFVSYCLFVIPISMVDLFSKTINKGVE